MMRLEERDGGQEQRPRHQPKGAATAVPCCGPRNAKCAVGDAPLGHGPHLSPVVKGVLMTTEIWVALIAATPTRTRKGGNSRG